ncbi:MAG: septum formation initiator family protein [Bacteroidales bacterium]|nr:septum formation initiator family protein [Bacteroidales bacterium]
MEQYKRKVKEIFNFILKNKILITILVFFVWILFFDQNSVLDLIKYDREISDLKNQKEYLITQINEDETKLNQLINDDKSLEKFAREEYFMHKPNEEVFVIKEVK